MKSPATLRKIADPKRRVVEASDAVREVTAKLEETRARRDMAACIARLDHGVEPVRLYRDALDCSRGLVDRMVRRAPSPEERAAIIAANPELYGDAETAVNTARKAGRDVVRVEEQLEEVRRVRDETGRGLMEGEFDGIRPMTNADFARLCKVTSARAAQIRYDDSASPDDPREAFTA